VYLNFEHFIYYTRGIRMSGRERFGATFLQEQKGLGVKLRKMDWLVGLYCSHSHFSQPF
jgi:hypothetical protein